jgi:replicative DNA helicase
MRQIVWANAKAGRRVLVESIEVSPDDIADALAATVAGVNARNLATAHKADQADYLAAVRALDRGNLHVFDCDRSLAAICARAKAINANSPLDLIAIDYLGLIADCEATHPGQTKASAIGRVTKTLKSLAMELGCVIICLSQLNRQSVTDGNREPRLSDLRDSGDIEQDADRVIFIHRPDEDPITKFQQKDTDDVQDRPRFFVNLIQAKGRNVGTSLVAFHFRRAVTRFEMIARNAA